MKDISKFGNEDIEHIVRRAIALENFVDSALYIVAQLLPPEAQRAIQELHDKHIDWIAKINASELEKRTYVHLDPDLPALVPGTARHAEELELILEQHKEVAEKNAEIQKKSIIQEVH